jgi:sialic acid synthase SpsE
VSALAVDFWERIAPAGEQAPPRVAVVASLGWNHGASLDRAMDLMISANAAGADAVLLPLGEPPGHIRKPLRRPPGSPPGLGMLIGDAEEVRDEAAAGEMAFVVGLRHPRDLDDARSLKPDAVMLCQPLDPEANAADLLRACQAIPAPLLVSCPDEGSAQADFLESWSRQPERTEGHPHGLCPLHRPARDPCPIAGARLGRLRQWGGLVGLDDTTSEVMSGAFAVAAGASVVIRRVSYNPEAEALEHAQSLDTVRFAYYADLARQAARSLGPLDRAGLSEADLLADEHPGESEDDDTENQHS